ncbi:MAG: hypothetical protein ACOC9V_03075 [Chloroflexota bacterium]
MPDPERYVEETFGILTDDDLYLDCILVKSPQVDDEDVRALRVWVPRYPLTKSSVITCARQEAQAYGASGKVAHLVFDLRGTGESEGKVGDTNFDRDLHAVRLWARERFGKISLGLMGRPHGSEKVDVRPIRPGVVMETYHYRPETPNEQAPIFFLSTYGNFSKADEECCLALADAGYDVFGADPLRYLLHASAAERLEVRDLWRDFQLFSQGLPQAPVLIGRPVSAGLALMWLSGVETTPGAIAIGRAQIAFKPQHIFDGRAPHSFFLGRHVHRIAPRPVVLVREKKHPLGGNRDELAALYETCSQPRRLEETEQVTARLLLELLDWLKQSGPAAKVEGRPTD